MGKKYIIEIEEEPLVRKSALHGETAVWRANGFNSLVFDNNGLDKLTPYTESDTESIRKEAYEQGYTDGRKKHEVEVYAIAYTNGKQDGYQNGLNDAWEAARKIGSNSRCGLEKMGFKFEPQAVAYYPSWYVVQTHSASECIEKILQYEQEKEEQIQVGDEVKSIERGWTAVVVRISNDDSLILMDSNGAIADAYNKTMFVKTGRHFSEIAEVLTKMRGK